MVNKTCSIKWIVFGVYCHVYEMHVISMIFKVINCYISSDMHMKRVHGDEDMLQTFHQDIVKYSKNDVSWRIKTSPWCVRVSRKANNCTLYLFHRNKGLMNRNKWLTFIIKLKNWILNTEYVKCFHKKPSVFRPTKEIAPRIEVFLWNILSCVFAARLHIELICLVY